MAHVNGDDIDDLFKRASDKYPLRTDSADWDKLAAALEKDPSQVSPLANTEGDKRRRRRFFWLFLLLPLGGLGYYAWQTAGHNQTRSTVTRIDGSKQTQGPARAGSASGTAQEAGTTVPAQAEGTRPAGSASGARVPNPAVPAATAPGQQGSTSEGSARTAGKTTAPAQAGTTPASVQAGSVPGAQKDPHPTGADTRLAGQDAPISGKHAHLAGQGSPIAGKDVYASGKGRSKQGKVHTGETPGTPGASSDPSTGSLPAPRNPQPSALNFRRALTTGRVDPDVTVTVNAKNSPVSAKDSGVAKSVPIAKPAPKKNSGAKDKKQSFLYGGLIVAPDLSTVKMQSVKGVGTTFGVLLGYQLNRKWAIETGLYLDRKKYYSDAEYFKKSYQLSSYDLINLNGVCNMWEIPVNLRYNLSTGQKSKWFATAGLSTYLMYKENYTFLIDPTNPWSKTWYYENHPRNWFSILNLSIGYEQKLGKIGNLRIEPYLRVPLSGVGTGSLPIMSAGLNIGITHRIW